MRKLYFFVIFSLVFSLKVFSQPKEITSDESLQELVKAFGKFSDTSWRKKQKYEYFKNGKISSIREEVNESLEPDRSRILRIVKGKGVSKEFETIVIGEKYYCRTNKGAWKQSDSWCDETQYFAQGMGDQVSAKYTVLVTSINNQKAKLYRQYITHSDENILSYWDYKFWITDDGFIVKRTIETGLLKTKEIKSRMTEIIEINPKDLKIEAPIK